MLGGLGWPGFKSLKLWRQEKGQAAYVAAFVEAITTGGAAPVPYAELVEVSERLEHSR